MEELCRTCKYAIWDYEEYYGGGRQYFVSECKHGGEGIVDCSDYSEE